MLCETINRPGSLIAFVRSNWIFREHIHLHFRVTSDCLIDRVRKGRCSLHLQQFKWIEVANLYRYYSTRTIFSLVDVDCREILNDIVLHISLFYSQTDDTESTTFHGNSSLPFTLRCSAFSCHLSVFCHASSIAYEKEGANDKLK